MIPDTLHALQYMCTMDLDYSASDTNTSRFSSTYVRNRQINEINKTNKSNRINNINPFAALARRYLRAMSIRM